VKIGDLVLWSPWKKHPYPGALSAIKYYERIRKRCGEKPGVILSVHEDNCQVIFNTDIIIIHKDFLEVIDASR